jgi:hypothetical protein
MCAINEHQRHQWLQNCSEHISNAMHFPLFIVMPTVVDLYVNASDRCKVRKSEFRICILQRSFSLASSMRDYKLAISTEAKCFPCSSISTPLTIWYPASKLSKESQVSAVASAAGSDVAVSCLLF